ncbi:DUF6262 family protein [Streptomyces sp. NPDC058240]|uniref:DUF6262 family protein n=1 Tax=Streptomyces sp. NPDC058240 TaxID=3346396 RepID=UPI0036E43F22
MRPGHGAGGPRLPPQRPGRLPRAPGRGGPGRQTAGPRAGEDQGGRPGPGTRPAAHRLHPRPGRGAGPDPPGAGHRGHARRSGETAAALAARRRKTETALQRAHEAIARLRREKAQVSVATVARRADVSRTFLYDNSEARTAVATAMAEADERRTRMLTDQDDEREATWRERALSAEDALKTAQAEILGQRTRIGELLGQVHDLEAEWTEEAIQQITTENTILKRRVRQLTTDNRTLDERLKAARSNLRFQDRRVADLEARVTNPGSAT